MVTRYGHTRTRAPGDGVPLDRIETPRLVYAVIAVCTVAGAFLRFYQLARPGYLFGVTEFDDGVQFGDALRLVSGVIPYRDFIVVQPPGSFLVMAPAAVLAKVTGSAWGLAIARLLTAAADTACVALLGLLVRHRGRDCLRDLRRVSGRADRLPDVHARAPAESVLPARRPGCVRW